MEIVRIIGAAFLMVGTSGAVLVYAGFGEVVSSFAKPAGPLGYGLAWDGNYLWFCGGPSNVFLKTTTEGSIVSSFTYGRTPTEYRGLTYDGQYLWVSQLEHGGGYNYRRLTTTGSNVSAFFEGYGDTGLAWEPPSYLWIGRMKMTTKGSLVSSFAAPHWFQGDLTWYGHYLWLGGINEHYFKFSTVGSIISSFPVPGNAPATGTAFDGNYVWMVNPTAGYVYQVDINVIGVDPASMGQIKGLYR